MLLVEDPVAFARDALERRAVHYAIPAAAIATGCVDFVLPPKKIAAALVALVMGEGAAEYFKVAIPAWF